MRLYLLPLGTMQPGDIPVPGYLVQTDDGTNILIDTGWPRSFVEAPRTRRAWILTSNRRTQSASG